MFDSMIEWTEIIPVISAESLPGLLFALAAVTLVLDTLRSYLKRAAQRSATAYGFADGVIPSEQLARIIIYTALPEIFRPRWAAPLILGSWLLASVGLLVLAHTMYGFLVALGIRIVPSVASNLFARVLDWLANSPQHEKELSIRPLHGREGA